MCIFVIILFASNIMCITCFVLHVIFMYVVLSKTQWSAVVTGRCMITMMVLLYYVNLCGMSLEYTVIVLMNNSLLGGQFCTDYVDIQPNGDDAIGCNRLGIVPHLNFTCNGRITSIIAKLWFSEETGEYPIFQVWRAASFSSTVYKKIREIQLQSNHQITSGNHDKIKIVTIILTGNNTIEVQTGDVVGYYHPPGAHYRVRTIQTDGYILYQFNGSHESISINYNNTRNNNQQPLIQFTIGKWVFNQA